MTGAMITLAISIGGLTALIGIKWWELKTRRIFFYGVRRRITHMTATALSVLFALVPAVFSRTVMAFLRRMRRLLRVGLAAILLSIETFLERTLHIVRHKTDPARGGGSASQFLQEVAEYKKQLSRPKKLR